jgi:hypothetical protein
VQGVSKCSLPSLTSSRDNTPSRNRSDSLTNYFLQDDSGRTKDTAHTITIALVLSWHTTGRHNTSHPKFTAHFNPPIGSTSTMVSKNLPVGIQLAIPVKYSYLVGM